MLLRGGMGHRNLPRMPSDRAGLRTRCCSSVCKSHTFLLQQDKSSNSSWRQSARITPQQVHKHKSDLFQLPSMIAFSRTRACSPLLQVPLTHHMHQNMLNNILKKVCIYIYCTHWTVLTYLCTDQSLFPEVGQRDQKGEKSRSELSPSGQCSSRCFECSGNENFTKVS